MGIESIGYTNVGSGARQHYGPRTVESQAPSSLTTYGHEQEINVLFDFDSLPARQAQDAVVLAIPAYSAITDVYLQVITPFAGGTSYNIGLQTLAGAEIDNDGFYAALALASINAIGATPSANGALAPAFAGTTPNIRKVLTNTGVAAGQVVVTATGTFTAGRARLVVKYAPLA